MFLDLKRSIQIVKPINPKKIAMVLKINKVPWLVALERFEFIHVLGEFKQP